ncbi:hypothetical protein ACHAWT_006879 [Skeletonema menzelii]
MPLQPLNPPRSHPRRSRPSSRPPRPTSAAALSVPKSPPPPPPPPLHFDPIIARSYGPTTNIYTDIFQVSPYACQDELNEAYNRVWKEGQIKLDDAAKNPSLKRKVMLQIDACFAAYQIVINAEKRKQYDKAIGLAMMAEEKKNENKFYRQEDVKGSFEDDDENDECKVSVARKSDYVQLSPIMADSVPKLLVLGPHSPEQSPHDEVDEIITPAHEKSKPLDRISLDKATCLDEPIISPTAVSEFDEHRIAIANDDNDDASYTSLHKSGRTKKSRRSRRKSKEKSSRRHREKKEVIGTRERDVESDEELDLFALYLNTCPCVQRTDHGEYGSDEESVLYD